MNIYLAFISMLWYSSLGSLSRYFTEETERMRARGTVKWFNDSKGYGFVTLDDADPNDLEQDVYVHHTAIAGDAVYKTLREGERVELAVSTRKTKRGSVRVAADVVPLS